MGFEMGMAELTRGTARCRSPPDLPADSRAAGISCSRPGHSGWLHTGGQALLREKRKPKVTKKVHVLDGEWAFLMAIMKTLRLFIINIASHRL